MDVAITTSTAKRSHVEALNGFVSMPTSIVVRHRNSRLEGASIPGAPGILKPTIHGLRARGLKHPKRSTMGKLAVEGSAQFRECGRKPAVS